MAQPTPEWRFRPPSRRLANWQLAVGAAAVIVLVVALLTVIGGDEGPEGVVASGTPTTSRPDGPTSTIAFQAPPPQGLATTTPVVDDPTASSTSPDTSSTSAPVTTTSSTTTTVATTTTTPPRAARPGPSVETVAGDHDAMRSAIAAARDRWSAISRPDGYVFRTRLVCFCPYGDNEIVVTAGGAVEGQRTIEGEAESDPETIEDVFDRLEAAVDGDASRIRASFDTELGYPVDFFIDYDERLADEEVGREIDWVQDR